MQQVDVERSQEFRIASSAICAKHLPRVRTTRITMPSSPPAYRCGRRRHSPLDVADRKEARRRSTPGSFNTKCCTEVCPSTSRSPTSPSAQGAGGRPHYDRVWLGNRSSSAPAPDPPRRGGSPGRRDLGSPRASRRPPRRLVLPVLEGAWSVVSAVSSASPIDVAYCSRSCRDVVERHSVLVESDGDAALAWTARAGWIRDYLGVDRIGLVTHRSPRCARSARRSQLAPHVPRPGPTVLLSAPGRWAFHAARATARD